MKNKILIMSVLVLSVTCGFSTETFAQADLAVLMQKMQEMEKRMNEVLPVGTILPFGGGSVPIGYLPCDGSVQNETDQGGRYKNLCQMLGTTFGKDCKLPDLRGRVVVGKDDMGGKTAGVMTKNVGLDGAVLGAIGGKAIQTLTVEQMPIHNHGVNESPHHHAASRGTFILDHVGGGAAFGAGPYFTNTEEKYTADSVTGITIQNEGKGEPHSIVQPSVVLNYIIKY